MISLNVNGKSRQSLSKKRRYFAFSVEVWDATEEWAADIIPTLVVLLTQMEANEIRGSVQLRNTT